MANNQSNATGTQNERQKSQAKPTTNSGRFEKGSDRAKEAGRKGGQKSSRAS